MKNSKQVRVSIETHRILKLEAAKKQTTMLKIIKDLIQEKYEVN